MATQQSGLVSGNSQNNAGGKTGQSRSMFPLSASVFQTERFAEYVPFFVMEGVSGDRLPLHSNHEVQTYTLKSPILQSLTKKKDYFAVPMQAILPLNWEKFYTNPNIGQDVPDDCGLGVENFWTKMYNLCNKSFVVGLQLRLADSTLSLSQHLEDTFRCLLFFEQIYSTGCLMETLGISSHNFIRIDSNNGVVTYDEMFDAYLSVISDYLYRGNKFNVTIGGTTYGVQSNPNDIPNPNVSPVTLREVLELMRDDLTFTITSADTDIDIEGDLQTLSQDYSFSQMTSNSPLNLGRLWAYQLCVAHFYSNDHVDFIYSAELFRQYINQLVTTRANQYNYNQKFVVNGLEYLYDALSAHSFNGVYTGFGADGIFSYQVSAGNGTSDTANEAYAYFTALFSFKRSLRFMDYFTGARSLPLAVGDHDVSIGTNIAGKLDIIELSKTSMMTKFLQAVNRSGRKFSAYMQELFGKTPAYDYHNPMYLAHNSDLVGAPETENTGAGQLDTGRDIAVTSRFKATANRFAFEFTPDRDCIVIGITYYDIPRVYTRATERQNFVIDRFDMFNPYLQFTGDQPIYEAEIGTDTPNDTPFAYTNKDMQYKQRFNSASGGFCVPSTGLDNWIFAADILRRKAVHHISPSYIRSFNSEIDRFYQRLTGYSLGTYFHFIVRYDNRMDASRPMAYNPTIIV